MTGRERLEAALNHQPADRPPIDLGAVATTGAHVTIIGGLRRALGLEPRPVRVCEPYQMLGAVDNDLRDALGIDTIGLGLTRTLFGYPAADWKPWVAFDGTPVLVPGGFNTCPEPNGDLLQYPCGDHRVPASGRMPAGGYYHDTIIRQPPLDDEHLCVDDNLEEFGPIPEAELERLATVSRELYENTPYGIVGNFGGTGFGDIALVPAPFLKNPKGIRDIEEWYISTVARRDHIMEIFARQCDIALANLELVRQAVGNRCSVVYVSGADFGTQNAPFISPDTYRELYQPFHKRVNDWIHQHTTWRTFIHSCGAVEPLIPEFIAAGFDVLNPVQCSARGMSPGTLKSKYGKEIVFWGGAVDTQRTLPFGTVQDVAREVSERLHIFGPDGGFVFNAIHNIQPLTPITNVLEFFRLPREAAFDIAHTSHDPG